MKDGEWQNIGIQRSTVGSSLKWVSKNLKFVST